MPPEDVTGHPAGTAGSRLSVESWRTRIGQTWLLGFINREMSLGKGQNLVGHMAFNVFTINSPGMTFLQNPHKVSLPPIKSGLFVIAQIYYSKPVISSCLLYRFGNILDSRCSGKASSTGQQDQGTKESSVWERRKWWSTRQEKGLQERYSPHCCFMWIHVLTTYHVSLCSNIRGKALGTQLRRGVTSSWAV